MKSQIYNEKKFLLPDSPRSMAAYHAKVMEDGIMKLTIHDCKGSIQLHNNLNNHEEITESLEKLTNLASGILELICFIEKNYEIKPTDMSDFLLEQLHHLNLSGSDILMKRRKFSISRQRELTIE
ncbi:MAG: hypothetical protein GZ091_04040 [Paludibacter sp.]|nr:hypothetical protein [Paludibacter sp.]